MYVYNFLYILIKKNLDSKKKSQLLDITSLSQCLIDNGIQ